MPDFQRLATVAASQASEAITELLRCATEPNRCFELEVVELLADATKIAIEADADNLTPERNQLLGALDRFLEGWA